MIEVSVKPGHIVAGRQARLAIRFANTGDGPCSDIVFRLELPSGISLVEGRGKIEVASIAAGGTRVHEITVVASKDGEFELTSGNFFYRDEYGVPAYQPDFRAALTVAAGTSDRLSSPRPVPSLAVRLEDGAGKLPIGVWSEIRVLVRNASDASLGAVTLDVAGPLRTNGRRSQVPQLPPGRTARFMLSVLADQGGQVPLGLRITFTYPDGRGSVRQASHDETVYVAVGTAGPGPAEEHAGTVLYLTASPKDPDLEWLPLRTDLEMRKVRERRQLSRQRERYRIESCTAARWDDVSQALADYDPQVVHFSGHGDRDGNLHFEDDSGGVALTTPEGLARLFSVHRATIKCVIVNACYSEKLARAMSRHIDYVVGMRWEIGDEAAIGFSVGFYTGLFAGHPVPVAFERGLAHIEGSETTRMEHRTPLLLRGL